MLGTISVNFKHVDFIVAQESSPNPGHRLGEIEGSETLVRISGNQTIAGIKNFTDSIIASNYCIGDECIDSWSQLEGNSSEEIIIIVDGSICPEGYFIDRISLNDCHVEGSCRMRCPSIGWVMPGSYYCDSFMPSPLWGCASQQFGDQCLRTVNQTKCVKNEYNDHYLSTAKQTIYGEKVFKNGLWINQNGNIRIGGTNNISIPSSQLEVYGDIFLTGSIKRSLADSQTLNIKINDIDRLSINKDGNIGIGKAPTVKLDVDGQIKANEIIANEIILSGLIKIGTSSLDCSSSEEGSMKYNQLTKNLELCNGVSWTSFSPKACYLNEEPQTTSWGDNQYQCVGDDHRCFNGECRRCEGSFMDGRCWYSVGAHSPCSDRGGVDNPYYADSNDCNICSTLVKNTNYWLGQEITCNGSNNYGPMAMFTGRAHYNPINCYYHNSSSDRENPPNYPIYSAYGMIYWAPCKY